MSVFEAYEPYIIIHNEYSTFKIKRKKAREFVCVREREFMCVRKREREREREKCIRRTLKAERTCEEVSFIILISFHQLIK